MSALEDPALDEAVETALYRLADADGVLLYVGVATDPWKRFLQHAATKRWWSDVIHVHLQPPPDPAGGTRSRERSDRD